MESNSMRGTIYENSKKHELIKNSKLEKIRDEIDIKIHEVCPFKPNLLKSSVNFPNNQFGNHQIYEIEDYKKHKEKLINYLKEKHPTEDQHYSFVPEINKK